MSMRPELIRAPPDSPCPRGLTAYLAIYNAVKCRKAGLIHGHLNDNQGRCCAVGAFFAAEDKGAALDSTLIDEIAIINDSCPVFTMKQRKAVILRWLKWKLETLGFRFPGKKSEKP